MKSIRKWFCKPKRSDHQLLAQFYFANEELNEVSQELDSFDGRQDPERCTALVNHLRRCQDKVLSVVEQIMIQAIPNGRANRDYRAKFPEDVLLDSLPGQLWFGAECLGAGSTIMNREIESAALRPLARGLTKTLDTMRIILKEQCYDNLNEYGDKVKDVLKKFDETFAEFELSYVSTMVPVKSSREYDTQQDVIVLFCETLNRALTEKLLTQDQVDDYDPGLMFTIPRLAIVSGLVVFPDGPLNMAKGTGEVSELFRPFQALLLKIKELLQTLSDEELHLLEKALCNSTGTWEDIEEQLKLMGRGSKVRCNAASQTDPTDFLEKGAEGGTNGEMMFGMSPIEEEVQPRLESEVSILGSSPNQNVTHDPVESEVPLADETEDQVDDGIESISSGIVEDNIDDMRSPSEIQSPGDLSNGDIFDDVDSHTLGMSPVEQKVEYKISPKHKSLALKRPLLDRVTGQDGMPHVYGMSPMEAVDKDFARDSLLLGVSPLDSPIVDSFEVSQARSDMLGMSPVNSVPSIPCKVTSEVEVDEENNRCYKTGQNNKDLCTNSVESVPKCSHMHTHSSASTNGFIEEDNARHSQTKDGINYVETIMEEIQSAATHRDTGNQGDATSVQCEDEKSMVIQMCQQLVDDIVQYAVQCSVFHSRHHGGRCLMTLRLSQYNVSPTCSSCGKVVYTCTKGQQDKIYCEQCKEVKINGLPSCQKDGTESVDKDIQQDGVKELEEDSNPDVSSSNDTVPLSECAKVIEENRMKNESNNEKLQQRKCTCGKASTNSSVVTSPKSPYEGGDLVNAHNKESKLTDDNTQQNPEIIYSTGAIQKSGSVAVGTGEGTPWICDGPSSWESPIFGKGKPSTELSNVAPSGERLTSPEGALSPAASLDDSNLSQSDSYNNSKHLTSYQVQSPSSGRVYPASAINRVTGSRGLRPEAALGEDEGAAGDSRRESNVSIAVCSSCGDELVDDDELYQWESDDTDSDSTSSVSDNDEHEIAIAIQAAELSARQEARSHFTSSWDLVHRLFVCIAGVADQLQTNYASDLRNILKNVFEITANPHKPFDESEMNLQTTTNSEVQSPSTEGQSTMSSSDQNIVGGATGVIPGAERAPFNEITVWMDSMEDPEMNSETKTEDLPPEMNTDQLNMTKLRLAPLEKGESLELGSTVSDVTDQSQDDDLTVDQIKHDDDVHHNRDSDDEVFTLNLEDENNVQDTTEILLDENKSIDSNGAKSTDDIKQIECQQQQRATAAVDEDQGKTDDTLKREDKTVSDEQQLPVVSEQQGTDEQQLPVVSEQQGADEQTEVVQGEMRTGSVDAQQHASKELYPEIGGDEEKVVDVTPVTVEESDQSVRDVTEQRTLDTSDFETSVVDQKTPEGSDSAASVTEQKAPEVSDSAVSDTEQNLVDNGDSVTAVTEQTALEGSDSAAVVSEKNIIDNGDSVAAVTKDQKVLEDSNSANGETGQKSPEGGGKSVTVVMDEKASEKDASPAAVKPKKKRHKSGDLSRRPGQFEEPPLWVPDDECSQCTSCQSAFTMIRRKHHCRNCGKIFCSRCSANCVPLPKFGQDKPVRVCNRCYMFQVTPFQH